MDITREQLVLRYSKMDEDSLMELYMQDSLTDQAKEAIQMELKSRGLSLDKAVLTQNSIDPLASAVFETAFIVRSQLIAAKEDATDDQRRLLESGDKWRSTFVLGYVVGLIGIYLQNRGVDGSVPGEALMEVARKAYGRDMEIVFAGLVERMGTDKAKREYEHGQNAALVEDLNGKSSMLKMYLLDRFDFDAEGNIQHRNQIA